MKVGILRCQQTEDICPGTKRLSTAIQGAEAFEAIGPADSATSKQEWMYPLLPALPVLPALPKSPGAIGIL